MRQYLALLKQCMTTGVRQKNRTGIDTFMIPGGMMQFDLSQGFPILTTKEVNFRAVAAELVGFIRGYTSAADFRALGTKIWDANANQNSQWLGSPWRKGEDDLGRIYGAQWRDYRGYKVDPTSKRVTGRIIDQLQDAYHLILKDPTSRRIIVNAWKPDELDQMALPPCHLLFQFLVSQQDGKLNLCMYQRSCDMFLGVPFNISSYALLLSLMATATRYKPGILTMFLADVHIYENHIGQVQEQLERQVKELPGLAIDYKVNFEVEARENFAWLVSLDPALIHLIGYKPHPPIKAPMAV